MDTRVERTIILVDELLHTGISVAGLASRVDLSLSRLSRLFRQEVGMTPGAYLHIRRMMRARALVERTSLSIREIMTQVGIADPSHFARDFRRIHGYSPRTLRMQLRVAAPPARYLTHDSDG